MSSDTCPEFPSIFKVFRDKQVSQEGVVDLSHPLNKLVDWPALKFSAAVVLSKSILVLGAERQNTPNRHPLARDSRFEMVTWIFLDILQMILFQRQANRKVQGRREPFTLEDDFGEVIRTTKAIKAMAPGKLRWSLRSRVDGERDVVVTVQLRCLCHFVCIPILGSVASSTHEQCGFLSSAANQAI